MKYVLVLLSALAALATANPVLETVVNEFGFHGDSLGWVELHAEPLYRELNLTGWQLMTSTSVCTFAYTITPGEFLVVDSASLAGGTYARGTFRLNPAGDSILLLPDSGSPGHGDGVKFPALPAKAWRSPLPPVCASASVFNEEDEVGRQTTNWYIDSTPTNGWENDDYSSVTGTVKWAPIRDFYHAEIVVSGPMGGAWTGVEASGQSYEALGLGAGRYAVQARGPGGDVIVTYPESVDVGYSQMLSGINFDFDPPEGVKALTPSRKPAPTVLSGASDVRRLASSVVFDPMGRRVPQPKLGIYFVRDAQAQAQAQAIRKVVITR